MSDSMHGRRWPRLAAPAAAVWSLVTALIGLSWLAGAAPFPFGASDVRAADVGSLFGSVTPLPASLVVVAVGVVGVVVAVVMTRLRKGWWLVAFGAVLSALLMFAVPDGRVIQNFAYLFFGYVGLWDLPLLFMVYSMLGAVLWAAAGVVHYRRVRGTCENCGRAAGSDGAGGPGWGTWVTYLAAALALPYGIVRFAWALGIPLGFPAAEVTGADLVTRLGETGLAALTFGGAILTVGLVRRWGERFPRWVPVLGGRRVPVWLAVVPATWAAALVVQGGLRVLVWTVTGDDPITADNWGAGGPGLAFLPWGVALGFATYAYYLRRRGACRYCAVTVAGAEGSGAARHRTA